MTIIIDNVEIKLTKEQVEHIVAKNKKEEFEYPVFKRCKHSGRIIKFVSYTTGKIVKKGKYLSLYDAGTEQGFCEHTDIRCSEDVAYDKERDLYDTQPIMCWNDADTHRRMYRFYNAITKCTFKYDGKRYGMDYKNYEAIQLNEIPQWMIKTQKTLTIEL